MLQSQLTAFLRPFTFRYWSERCLYDFHVGIDERGELSRRGSVRPVSCRAVSLLLRSPSGMMESGVGGVCCTYGGPVLLLFRCQSAICMCMSRQDYSRKEKVTAISCKETLNMTSAEEMAGQEQGRRGR